MAEKCKVCGGRAINMYVIAYHDGYGALARYYYCIEHTPETKDRLKPGYRYYNKAGDLIEEARPHYMVWGKTDVADYGIGLCDECNRYKPRHELHWTDDDDYLCEDCDDKQD